MDLVLPKKCKFCESKDIKQSLAYPTYWFCNECKDGAPMKDDKKQEEHDTLLAEFERMLNS